MTYTLDQETHSTQTNFSVQIEEIIGDREKLSQEVKTAKDNLDRLLNYLENLNDQKENICNQLKDKAIKSTLQKVDFQSRIEEFKKEQLQVEKLLSRFSRATINIAVVGKAGQGKSTLLQTLTGLGNNIIPSSNADHCTAVKSKISNHLNGSIKTTINLIRHDKESLFKEVIAPYYSALSLQGNIPNSLEDFINNPLAEEVNGNTDVEYEHLTNYYNKLKENPRLLSLEEIKDIQESNLSQYIAQDTNSNFEYFKIKEIDIKCVFPSAAKMGIQKLAFIDMPGLGDGKSHNSANLLQTLGEEIDLVLFLYKPSSTFRFEGKFEQELQKFFQDKNGHNTLANLPIKQWSFYIANYHPASEAEHDNRNSCVKFRDKINEKEYVQDVIIANCNNEEEATINILTPILNYLTKNLNTLDREYASNCRESLENCHEILKEELDRASIYTQGANSNHFGELTTEYTNEFNKLFNDLKTALTSLANNLDAQKDNKDTTLEKFIDTAIDNCNAEKLLPSLDIMIKEVNNDGYVTVHTNYLKKFRAEILTPFNEIDKCFHQSLENTKIKIAEKLIEKGKLDKIILKDKKNSDRELEVDLIDFFDDLLKAIPNIELKNLRQAIENINKFTINYRAEVEGIIKHKDNVKHITPEDTTYKPTDWSKNLQKKVNPGKFKDNAALYTRNSLIAAYSRVIQDSEPKLRKLSEDPNRKLAEMIKTFIDEAFRTEGVKDDWRKFLSYYIAEIWPEKFAPDADDNQLKQEWVEKVIEVQTINSSLAILNF